MQGNATTTVKICGLSTAETVNAAIDAGADMIGLALIPKSPRNVTVAQAAQLAGLARGRARIVALMVDPDDGLVTEVAQRVLPRRTAAVTQGS